MTCIAFPILSALYVFIIHFAIHKSPFLYNGEWSIDKMRQKFIIKTDCILGEDKMIYKMNIDNYNYFFTDRIAKRGKSYYRDNRVRNMMKRPDGKYQLSVRGDSQTYRVVADIRKNGDIEDIECNCLWFIDILNF